MGPKTLFKLLLPGVMVLKPNSHIAISMTEETPVGNRNETEMGDGLVLTAK